MRSEVENIDTDGSFQDVRDVLSGDIGVLSLDNGVIRNGSEKQLEQGEFYMGPIDEISGNFVAFSSNLASELTDSEFPNNSPFTMSYEEARNNFYFGHGSGAPWELKVDPDYDLEESEEWHLHNGWELYSAMNGALEVGMADLPTTDPEDEDITYQIARDDNLVFVPPYVPHRVTSEHGDPTHVVGRYSDERDRISRFDKNGNIDYSWGDNPDFQTEGLKSYNQENESWLSEAQSKIAQTTD